MTIRISSNFEDKTLPELSVIFFNIYSIHKSLSSHQEQTSLLRGGHGDIGNGASRQLQILVYPINTIPGENQVIAIKTAHSTYIRADSNRDNRVDTRHYIKEWERFTLVKVSGQNGVYAIKTHHNTYLRAESGVGARVNTQNYVDDWEKFTIEKVSQAGENGLHHAVFAFKTYHGTYLRAKPSKRMFWWWNYGIVDTQSYVGDWEKFVFYVGVLE